jgi:hypothetical protein
VDCNSGEHQSAAGDGFCVLESGCAGRQPNGHEHGHCGSGGKCNNRRHGRDERREFRHRCCGSATASATSATNAGTSASAAAASALQATASVLLRGYIGGLTLSNDATMPNTVLDIAAGMAASDDNTTLMSLASAITKTTSAWASGTGHGGLDTGSVAASTGYHIWLIENTSGALVDVLFSLSATSPTMPSGYTKKRRIGWVRTNASSQIIQFVQNGDEFLYITPINDVDVTNLGTSATLFSLSVPNGVKVNALMTAGIGAATAGAAILINSPDQTASSVGSPLGNTSLWLQVAAQAAYGQFNIRTSVGGQIRAVANLASTTFVAATQGWVDTRGNS